MTADSIVAASISITLVLLISYGFLYFSEKKHYFLAWSLSVLTLMITYLSRTALLETNSPSVVLQIINYASSIAGYWLVFKGTQLFFSRSYPVFWDIGTGFLILAFICIAVQGIPTTALLLLSVVWIIALLSKAAMTCLKAKTPQGPIRIILGYTYIFWALSILLYPLCKLINVIPPSVGYLVAGVVGLLAYLNMQALYFQSIREELESKEANIRKLVIYDKLTGAYSRTYFENTLEDFLDKTLMPAALVMGDFNGLKLINDTFGHEKGDELLADGVRIMQETIGPENVIIRWGGDEFIIIMPGVPLDQAGVLLNNVKDNLKISRPKTVPIDISFGSTFFENREQPLAEMINQAEEKMYSNKLNESKKTRLAIIEFLEKLLWEKDYQTEAHVMRLKSLVSKFGSQIGLSAREIVELVQVAMLHDIGKIGVPGEILKKQGDLTPEEWSIMKKHSEIGYRITQSSRELAHVSEAVLGHHEWWNGKGYPQGLKEDEIPLFSRIVSIVDSYDVITHERPYKRAMDPYSALVEINKCAGKQFDPYLVTVFNKIMQESLVVNDR
ncbi:MULTISPECIES: diguanylate cyclase [unclassified Dehalobacter]|uniref:diguanylate cyclase n=1 Tax=unclassified Dehalobacter TaxID=2635733 RepID=UPI000E6D13BF|nr:MULTISPECIES: diguanylate cyclase [unclassified Dehalobacter]RJE47966.1 phosphohydrolase [Dehalobacter sp. MCB1]TCX50626.1 diguanylate cyclase [Dehalobacter sp. 14DCB1]TCX52130.1 diguanylate cyclase [Dehalobacter sp. 12DCB1]